MRSNRPTSSPGCPDLSCTKVESATANFEPLCRHAVDERRGVHGFGTAGKDLPADDSARHSRANRQYLPISMQSAALRTRVAHTFLMHLRIDDVTSAQHGRS